MFNAAVEYIYTLGHNSKVRWYTSTNRVLKFYVQRTESGWRFARRQNCFHIRANLVRISLGLSRSCEQDQLLPIIREYYSPDGQIYPGWTHRNDSDVQKHKSHWQYLYFSVIGDISVCLLDIAHVHGLSDEKREEDFKDDSNGRSIYFSVCAHCWSESLWHTRGGGSSHYGLLCDT